MASKYYTPYGQNIHPGQFQDQRCRSISHRSQLAQAISADGGACEYLQCEETPYTFSVMAAMLLGGQAALEATARCFQRQGVL